MAPSPIYPLGNQSFEKIRHEGRLYIDKTMFISPLIQLSSFIFLSRPRRFGKSLFMSTLEAYFRGRSDLFERLAIAQETSEWIEYPVIHLDFSKMGGSVMGSLRNNLAGMLNRIAKEYGLELDLDRADEATHFGLIIETLAKKYGRNVVVLIDEYDVPVHGLDTKSEVYKENQQLLRSIFIQCKGNDSNIKFCFVTGVARFNQMNLFSGANNFTDISMYPDFASICGFTHEEVRSNLAEGINRFADEACVDPDEIFNLLEAHYDGYRFTRAPVKVFNPLSILYSLVNREFGNYWVNTGLTSVFIDRLTDPRFELPKLTDEWVSDTQLAKIYDSADPLSLMFQTGYLTIRDYRLGGGYRLSVPNQEVMASLTEYLIPSYLGRNELNEESVASLILKLKFAIINGEIEKMMGIISSILAGIAYHMFPKESEPIRQKENYYHTMVYLIFMMMKSNTVCEMPSSRGRSDMVAETQRFVYIFEFKMDDTAGGTVEAALRQIDERGYADKYRHTGKIIYKIGVVFSSANHDIANWGCRSD